LAVSIDSLHHDAANARRHGERNLDAIRASLAQFGQRKPIVVQRDGMIVRAGNGTLEAARALGWSEIAAVVIDEDGTKAAQFAIADNRTAELAEWDNETLTALLNSWNEQERSSLGFDQKDYESFLSEIESKQNDDGEEKYSRNIETPIYEPKGEKPKISELTNATKFLELKSEIDECLSRGEISKQESDFLNDAAYRHLVFSYSKIAEFYCHASPKMQKLMEDSALVVIDFNSAIEGGFVKLTKQLAEIVGQDMTEDDDA
jgi:hypothetical protein